MTDTDRPTPPRLAQYRYVWVERRAPAARRGRLSTLAILRPELPYTGNHDGVIAAYRATLARYEREGHPPCALCGAPAAQAANFVLLIEALNGPELWPLRWKASTACSGAMPGRMTSCWPHGSNETATSARARHPRSSYRALQWRSR